MSTRPENIGIKAIEIYFPNQCVSQAELEKFDGVSAGKYTIGFGQTKMSFYIYSITLTTVKSLLEKYNIDPTSIGRLEVGTETLLDKSKSVKSVLMRLFTPSGNTSIEGVDTLNACYGGTNALFNAINWVESSAWDGRDAIVVAGDIALYSKGNARPNGGAGCVAMLVGPDAPLVFEPGKRGTYMAHAYDFYKPDFTSEYPHVDGHFSLRCYTEAVDACYKAYNKREAALARPSHKGENGTTAGNGVANGNGIAAVAPPINIDRFDFMLFHAPTCKLVSKSYARLLYNDFLAAPDSEQFATVPQDLRELDYEHSLSDRNIEKAFMGLSKKRFEERVKPSLLAPTECGNMYTASVYSGLVSLLSNVDSDTLQGKRIALFSYGSGLASSLFSLTVKSSTKEMAERVDLKKRLDARRVVEPQVYNDASPPTPLVPICFLFANALQMCDLRHQAHGKSNYEPKGNTEAINKGTYYCTKVDERFRREYQRK